LPPPHRHLVRSMALPRSGTMSIAMGLGRVRFQLLESSTMGHEGGRNPSVAASCRDASPWPMMHLHGISNRTASGASLRAGRTHARGVGVGRSTHPLCTASQRFSLGVWPLASENECRCVRAASMRVTRTHTSALCACWMMCVVHTRKDELAVRQFTARLRLFCGVCESQVSK